MDCMRIAAHLELTSFSNSISFVRKKQMYFFIFLYLEIMYINVAMIDNNACSFQKKLKVENLILKVNKIAVLENSESVIFISRSQLENFNNIIIQIPLYQLILCRLQHHGKFTNIIQIFP